MRLIFIILGVFLVYFLLKHFLPQKQENPPQLVVPVTSNKQKLNLPLAIGNLTNDKLRQEIEEALKDTKGTYGIVVKNLKTEENYQLNEHKTFQVGSLYKLWIMATVFNKIQSGVLTGDEELSSSVDVLNGKFNIDPDLAEMTEGTITLTVGSALKQMITISHNYAALLLTEKIRLSNVAAFLKEQDFKESKVGVNGEAPVSTPFDIASFFEKLYKGKLGNAESTGKMLELLKQQTLNNKLPKGLPQGIAIAHKTGELGYFTHDAGIVFSEKGDYIIVILSESDYPPGAEERIGMVSKAVYEYFQKN
ncbi:serine hydrolase [Candidatus Daviesbacteria bacterium]|nr:serine hydrolase [Candidatus Daviesbacteria bacterium]